MAKKTNSDEIVKLLKSNKNLILTGAPGTGKTYLAKEIAEAMGATESNGNLGFVQFHPSYDYTDFVEGLRPTPPDENGNIGFERKDGVFKEFCERALSKNINTFLNDIKKAYEILKNGIKNGEITTIDKKKGNSYNVTLTDDKQSIVVTISDSNSEPKTEDKIIDFFKNLYSKNQNIDFDNITTNDESLKNGNTAANWAICNKIFQLIKKDDNPKVQTTDSNSNNKIEITKENSKPFIFIIDEINRGEISKIFGELFFSIDPSYRGEKWKVQTQYANLQTKPNEFDKALSIEEKEENKGRYGHFFVPDNVYIIGTMNDIDRSVESFDFAMRRRFTWQEITAEESAKNMKLSEATKNKMKSLNEAISSLKDKGLNSSYHIGGAYFLDKDGKERTDYDEIWKLRLRPLLFEYLRGMSDAENQLNKLEQAYDNAG